MDSTATQPEGMNRLSISRGLYFSYYMALGAFMPYINLYFERKGLSGLQIGTLAAVGVLVSSPAAILWSSLADRLKMHRPMLILSVAATPVCVWLLGRTTKFPVLIPIVIAYALAMAPIIPLLDGAALDVTRRLGRSYGEARVGGTVGWIVSVALVGLLIQTYDVGWLFYAYIACMALMLVFSLFQGEQSQSLQAPWSANVRGLLADRTVVFFLISVFIVAVGNGAVQNFFSLYLDGIGAGEGIIGAAWAVAAVSEIPVMMYAGRLMQRIGAADLLKLAFFVYAVRWLLFSFIHDPILALAAQLLQGLSFAAYLTAGVTYLNERTPEGLATTAQSIFNAACFGLAGLVGSPLGGYLYDHAGMPVFFRVFSLTTLAGLAVFWVSAGHPWRAAYGTNA